MATSTEPSTLRSRVPVLDQSKLRTQILEYLTRAGASARAAVANPDPAIGVHELRKAARRVRAIADLAREAITRRDRRAVRDAIRHARHLLGPARDHAVVAHSLSNLSLEEPVREAATLLLAATADCTPDADTTRRALAEAAAIVVGQVDALQIALGDIVTFEMLVEGIRATYGRARRARKAAKRSKRAFHTWRRRTKELGYQLEVLGDAAGPRLTELREAVREVAAAQRDAVDLLMIRGFARAHRSLVDRDAHALLADTLSDDIRPLLAEVRRAGKAAFRKKPRQLARTACRDVAVGAAHA